MESERTDFSTGFTHLLQSFFVSKPKSNIDLNLKKLSEQKKVKENSEYKPKKENTEKELIKEGIQIVNKEEIPIVVHNVNKENIKKENTFTEFKNDSDTFSVKSNDTFTESESDYVNEKKENVNESVNNKSEPESEYIDFNPKKFIMNYSNLTKGNIYIMNRDFDDNIFILTDILKTLSLMKNIENVYNDKSYIITDKINQVYYKKIILENPDIHFTNYFSLPKSKIEELSENKKKSIVVIDTDTISEKDYLKLVGSLNSLKVNIQFIFITTNIKLNNDLQKIIKTPMIIHCHDSKKSLQKEFFNTIVKPNIKQFEKTDFENYYNFVNQEVFGIRYIFLHNNEFKYC